LQIPSPRETVSNQFIGVIVGTIVHINESPVVHMGVGKKGPGKKGPTMVIFLYR